MPPLSINQLFKIWSKVALNSFGGPAGQIAIIHKVCVEEHQIVTEDEFSHALNFCMFLPGPEAQQLATYLGWKTNSWIGGLIAGGLFILPGFISILILSYLYILYGNFLAIQGFFYGAKSAIIAIVLSALFKMSKRSLKNSFYYFIFAFSFLAIFFMNLPFPIIVTSSALLGIIYGKSFSKNSDQHNEVKLRPKFSIFLLTSFVWICVWIFPIILVYTTFGENSLLHHINIFFSKMSVVTFGGAYTALAYVSQEAVNTFSWITNSQMLDGLAMAETTPGPLIQSVQFVGFMAIHNSSIFNQSMFYPFLASVLVTWMTFAPSFLWIFTLAPYVEFIRHKKVFSDALNSISASVVGVILNLCIWFSVKVLFIKSFDFEYFFLKFPIPELDSIDLTALLISLVSAWLVFSMKKSIHFVMLTSIILGCITIYFKL